MVGCRWESLGQQIPTMSLNQNNPSLNPILTYFLNTFLLMMIILVQYIARHALKTWLPLKVQEFVNLCTVSNISVFILDDNIHGYYIHGQAPGGVAEGTAAHLQ